MRKMGLLLFLILFNAFQSAQACELYEPLAPEGLSLAIQRYFNTTLEKGRKNCLKKSIQASAFSGSHEEISERLKSLLSDEAVSSEQNFELTLLLQEEFIRQFGGDKRFSFVNPYSTYVGLGVVTVSGVAAVASRKMGKFGRIFSRWGGRHGKLLHHLGRAFTQNASRATVYEATALRALGGSAGATASNQSGSQSEEEAESELRFDALPISPVQASLHVDMPFADYKSMSDMQDFVSLGGGLATGALITWIIGDQFANARNGINQTVLNYLVRKKLISAETARAALSKVSKVRYLNLLVSLLAAIGAERVIDCGATEVRKGLRSDELAEMRQRFIDANNQQRGHLYAEHYYYTLGEYSHILGENMVFELKDILAENFEQRACLDRIADRLLKGKRKDGCFKPETIRRRYRAKRNQLAQEFREDIRDWINDLAPVRQELKSNYQTLMDDLVKVQAKTQEQKKYLFGLMRRVDGQIEKFEDRYWQLFLTTHQINTNNELCDINPDIIPGECKSKSLLSAQEAKAFESSLGCNDDLNRHYFLSFCPN